MSERRIIQNADVLGANEARREALGIAEAGLAAIDTARVLEETIKFESNHLCVNGDMCSIEEPERIFYVAVGKCAAASAEVMERVLGEKLVRGIVLDVAASSRCKELRLKKIECLVGTHPAPSQQNVDATGKILGTLSDLTPKDVVIVLVSGGGSTLLCQPPQGMTFEDEAVLYKELTHRGATIVELNTVRKHLSHARGGWLARAAYPAQVVGLVISDVPGDSMEFIASGPTVRDNTSIADAQAVLDRYSIPHGATPLMETPKEEKYFERVENMLVVNNMRALKAMKKEAEKRGFAAHIVTDAMQGEARDVAATVAATLHDAPHRTVLLYGGETTVTIENPCCSDGGRNLELAIAALPHVHDDELLLSLASDGRDNCDYAGGIADVMTRTHAEGKGISIDGALRTHASYTFFENTGDAVVTGETGTNVSDLLIAVKS